MSTFEWGEKMIFVDISGFEYATSKALYEETNSTADKWSKILIALIIIFALPACQFSKFLSSFDYYFSTDLDSITGDEFELAFPSW